MFEDDGYKIVRCFCCGSWVRQSATEEAPTGVRGDLELWCIGCLRDVDAYTLTLEQPELKETVELDLEEGE